MLRQERLLFLRLTPLATASNRNPCAMDTMAPHTAWASLLFSRSVTNEGPTFEHVERQLPQVAEGQAAGGEIVDREAHADIPQRPQALRAPPASSIKARSVNSSSMSSGSTRVRLQHAAKCVIESELPELSGGDVYPTRGKGTPALSQRLSCRQTSSIIHTPMGTMPPLSSAADMNSPGLSNPRSGCFQCSSASTASIR